METVEDSEGSREEKKGEQKESQDCAHVWEEVQASEQRVRAMLLVATSPGPLPPSMPMQRPTVATSASASSVPTFCFTAEEGAALEDGSWIVAEMTNDEVPCVQYASERMRWSERKRVGDKT